MCAHQVSIFSTLFSISSESSAALRPRLVLRLQQNHHHRSSIILYWLGPSSTTYLQPPTQGVIECLWRRYCVAPFSLCPIVRVEIEDRSRNRKDITVCQDRTDQNGDSLWFDGIQGWWFVGGKWMHLKYKALCNVEWKCKEELCSKELFIFCSHFHLLKDAGTLNCFFFDFLNFGMRLFRPLVKDR